tara:strand:+ start:10217 stop:10423 length:207 start_codon:yes stop_codon:yes gene_type:complete
VFDGLMSLLHWIFFIAAVIMLIFGGLILHRGDSIGYGYMVIGIAAFLIFNVLLLIIRRRWQTFPWSDY